MSRPYWSLLNIAGRADRCELARYVLIVTIVALALVAGRAPPAIVTAAGMALGGPGVALLVRRLHDTGRHGAALWLAAIPPVGPVVLLVWLAAPGQRGANRHGVAPPDAARGPAVPPAPSGWAVFH